MSFNLPTIELLEQAYTFPCPYVFKVIGKAEPGFIAKVVAVVREALHLDVDPQYHEREAVGGRHVAVTLEPIVASPEQVLAIYRSLSVVDGVVMMF